MKISCAFHPTTDTPAHIEWAESLGYARAYCVDSPALVPDLFVTLALAAQRTSRIGLATGMLIPRLRHVMTTAAALATLNRLAPGRIVMGVGVGFTGSRLLGKRPMRWAEVLEYAKAVRALLRGEEVVWDDSLITFVPSPDFRASLPVELPILVASDGPKGRAVARELEAGLCALQPVPQAEFEWLAHATFGTVLEAGESPTSDRVMAVAGLGMAIAYHSMYDLHGARVDELPGGAAWREQIESIPLERRHIEIHRGHGTELTARDWRLLPREMVGNFSLIGDEAAVAQQVRDLAAAGVSELLYSPAGDNIPHELEKFAGAAMSAVDGAGDRTRT